MNFDLKSWKSWLQSRTSSFHEPQTINIIVLILAEYSPTIFRCWPMLRHIISSVYSDQSPRRNLHQKFFVFYRYTGTTITNVWNNHRCFISTTWFICSHHICDTRKIKIIWIVWRLHLKGTSQRNQFHVANGEGSEQTGTWYPGPSINR